VQIYVARKSELLSETVRDALRAAGKSVADVRWVAPKESELFREPSDAAFLTRLGLPHAIPALRRFWPAGGPTWDALGVLDGNAKSGGVVLVEAKSYPRETYGAGCKAVHPQSVEDIHRSLGAAQRWFRVSENRNWTGRLYQYANRLAHVYFLRHEVGVDAWLVNLCFTGDATTTATSRDSWNMALPGFKRELGFVGEVPWVIDVVVPAFTRPLLVGSEGAS
jgi:hypothetical protein